MVQKNQNFVKLACNQLDSSKTNNQRTKLYMNKLFIILASVLILSSCKKQEEEVNIPSSSKPNILLIIADDMGKDATSGFDEGTLKPTTPNINSLMNAGMTFDNFWVYPTCSPTRASIITGKYGYRTGVKWASDELVGAETILHKYINQQTNNAYATALVGKWHLSGNGTNIMNPEDLGMDYYAGLLGGGVQSYSKWQFTEDGEQTEQTEYITKTFTNLAIDWIQGQDKPWLMWLAYTAPHTPFHEPPSAMHSQGDLPEYTESLDPMPYYLAAIEAMDFQIGRLLESIPSEERENTLIIFIGDNGTPNQVAQLPYTSMTVKGSLYQGGINTPMFVSGKGVSRTGVDSNLITSTDLYSTIAQIGGSPDAQIHDSKSFYSLFSESKAIRKFQYCEKDDGNSDLWTISNGNYKIIEDANGDQEMYDLSTDPYEKLDLLQSNLNAIQQAVKVELEAELVAIRQ